MLSLLADKETFPRRSPAGKVYHLGQRSAPGGVRGDSSAATRFERRLRAGETKAQKEEGGTG